MIDSIKRDALNRFLENPIGGLTPLQMENARAAISVLEYENERLMGICQAQAYSAETGEEDIINDLRAEVERLREALKNKPTFNTKVDPTLPPGVVLVRGETGSEVRIVNVGEDKKGGGE